MGLGTAERRSSAAAAKHPPCRTSHCNKLHTEASTEESATTTRHPTQRGAPTTPSDQEEIQLTSNHRTQPSGRYDQQASQQYPKCRTTQLQPAATSQTRRPRPSRPSPNIHDTYRDPRGTSNIKNTWIFWVLTLPLQWVLLSTNILCVYTHQNALPSILQPTAAPLCYHPTLTTITTTCSLKLPHHTLSTQPPIAPLATKAPAPAPPTPSPSPTPCTSNHTSVSKPTCTYQQTPTHKVPHSVTYLPLAHRSQPHTQIRPQSSQPRYSIT